MKYEEEFRETEWGCADGRRIKIKDMELGHLVNVINWVHDHHDGYSDYIRKNLIAEAEYRKLSLFASGKPYPREVDGRWMIYDVTTKQNIIEPPPQEYIDAVADNPRYQDMLECVKEYRKQIKNKSVDKPR